MTEPLKRVRLKTKAETLNFQAEAVWIGADLLVMIWGGDRPHIGAVAAAQPRPSLKDPSVTSATASVLAFLGHKEDVLAKMASEALASALNTNVVVAAGLHWDNLDEPGIRRVMENARQLIKDLIRKLGT
ncbi:MAG: hypothetical protein AB1641_18705 [Thermodesulfobacteriota bacterium]